jgi:hypothetical protein
MLFRFYSKQLISPDERKPEQMLLDFGQRSLGKKINCPRCSLLYCKGDIEDEAAHALHCDPWTRGVSIKTPYRDEKVLDSNPLDDWRVVEVSRTDRFQQLKVSLFILCDS